MSTPRCPVHNVEMVLKTAKKGRNAGGKFWGCPTWPITKCRETLPFTEDGNGESAETTKPNLSLYSQLPRSFSARSRFEGFQVRFFESVAVSETSLENILESELSETSLRAFSQWRVDYPPNERITPWKERERQAISVAEKLLTRGRLTLCSPSLEQKYTKRFLKQNDSVTPLNLTDKILFPNLHSRSLDYLLDSRAETMFFEEFLPSKLGSNFHCWVIPQVEIASLLSPNLPDSVSGRIDFLICHPNLEPIVVEIDGEEHQHHRNVDERRDAALFREGYKVIRIPTAEIEHLEGENLSILNDLLALDDKVPDEQTLREDSLTKFIHAIKVSHQIQLIIIQAIQTGFLALADSSQWKLSTDLVQVGLFNQNESLFILKSSVADLLALLRNLGKLYSIPVCQGEPKLAATSDDSSVHISFTGEDFASRASFFVQNVSVPFHIANSVFTTSPAILEKPSQVVLGYFLNYIFRKPSFWEGQVDAITRTLEGKDSIVLLPTGAGKSIAFQLASLLLPGRAIVIDPIISLMEDQIDNLQSVGIDRAVAITSQITDPHDRSRVLSLFGQGEYLFAYIAPERFQIVEFREALRTLTVHTPISLIAVDEAHCVSEWGHDFRTAYLNIGRTSRIYSESDGITPPLLALTGTASRAVLKDVQRELQIEDFDSIITPKSFDRPELKFHVFSSSSAEKSARLLGYLGQTLPGRFSSSRASFFQPNGKSTYSGLVFCPHVNGPFGVVEISDKIKASLAVTIAFYSGKEPKFYSKENWGSTKQDVARQFKHNQVPVLVCTKAFGMGIDKPNIRYTVHFGIPSSIESFYQEAGRAGRDRRVAHCCILVSDDDPERTKRLLNPSTKTEEIHRVIQGLAREENDDITRALYFQTIAFPGIAAEKSRVVQVIQAFPDISKRETRTVRFSSLERNKAEKGLHRLLILGVIADYTINYNSDEFTIKIAGATKESIIDAYGKYVAGYLKGRQQVELEKSNKFLSLPLSEFILAIVEILLHFIYEVIERGRRRALYEMLLAATASPSDSSIRQRILRYLEATEYSDALEQVIAERNAGLEKTKDTFETIRSPNESAELRGQVARYLESYPDHPGLLMLRALSEIYSRDKNPEIAKQNFLASISSAEENYGIKGQPLFDFIVWALSKIPERNPGLAEETQASILTEYPDRMLARDLVRQCPVGLAIFPTWFLIDRLTERSKKLVLS